MRLINKGCRDERMESWCVPVRGLGNGSTVDSVSFLGVALAALTEARTLQCRGRVRISPDTAVCSGV